MAKRKPPLPPKPDCGSIEINKMIGAINEGLPNPCTENQECIDFYNNTMADKAECEKLYPEEEAYYSLVEPDEYEEALLERLI